MDFGSDVGVDGADFVLEDVAEALGLGDFGDAVGDHPGFVAVAEAVECQVWFDGLDEDGWACAVEVAVGGGAHGAAAEVGASE
ncbi:hypothetical protein LWC34_45645 [Kibdelosporangium philippinense]|uniref:Uncharacterized protein n=1 Tax=Kibdelosporangium philippinense TaxID=211113 RepID=A0ABS8ZSS8_9PSEU|nr:hypothetical protein [Kibdelosporangium philippinense]MCE7010045.1 hypothetical protein [Kibdelosporangium philippinense]